MKKTRLIKIIAVAITTVLLGNPAFSQQIDQQILAELGFSSEAFTVCGLTPLDTSATLNNLSDSTIALSAYQQAKIDLFDAEAELMELASQVAEQDGEQSASTAESIEIQTEVVQGAKTHYSACLEQLREASFVSLNTQQTIFLRRVMSENMATVPHIYRLLDWNAREMRRLTRSLRMRSLAPDSMTAQDNQIIASANANFDVIQAEIWLETRETGIAQVFEEFTNPHN